MACNVMGWIGERIEAIRHIGNQAAGLGIEAVRAATGGQEQ